MHPAPYWCHHGGTLGSSMGADPLLCQGRLRPDAWFGPLSSLIEEELGEDAQSLLGRHADTMALLSSEILRTPKGEPGLRSFLRHLRDLLARSPAHSRTLLDRAARAEEEAARHAAAAGQAREAAARLEAEVSALHWELQRERAASAAERKDAERWAAGMTRSMEVALAEQHGRHRQEAAHSQHVAATLQDQLMQQSSQKAQAAAQLSEAQRALVERNSQLAVLQGSLRVGADWLGAGDMPFGGACTPQLPFMTSAAAGVAWGS